MTRYLTVVPAYGRDYKTEEEARSAFSSGVNFKIGDVGCCWDGSYTTRGELEGCYDVVNVRYAALTEAAVVDLRVTT